MVVYLFIYFIHLFFSTIFAPFTPHVGKQCLSGLRKSLHFLLYFSSLTLSPFCLCLPSFLTFVFPAELWRKGTDELRRQMIEETVAHPAADALLIPGCHGE